MDHLIAALFNKVAPIFIYHRADVLFKEKATDAYNNLGNHPHDTYKKNDLDPPPQDAHLDELDSWAKDSYDTLFKKIVEEHKPDWTFFYDTDGSKGYKDGNGKYVFAGDKPACFPMYETAELLIERLNEHDEDAD